MRSARASLWCAHPRLRPGESFSSWLHRSAYANGLSNHTYCRYVFGGRPVWNRDVDHLPNDDMLQAAADATLETAARLRSATLSAFSGLLYEGTPHGGHFPWVLSLGVYHRTRRRHGQQFCPACLREGTPWLRLEWRLAWAVCCPEHGCYLRDACHRCDVPFVFHRASLAVPGRLECHACGANVLATPAGFVEAPHAVVRLHQSLVRSLHGRPFSLAKGRAVPALEFFSGLRVLVRGVFDKAHWVGMGSTAPARVRRGAPPRPPMQVEHWRLRERVYAMDVLRWALVRWPGRFVSECHRAGVYRARFQEKPCAIEWLDEGLEGLRMRPSVRNDP